MSVAQPRKYQRILLSSLIMAALVTMVVGLSACPDQAKLNQEFLAQQRINVRRQELLKVKQAADNVKPGNRAAGLREKIAVVRAQASKRETLRDTYRVQLAEFRDKLQPAIAAAGIGSHEDLLRTKAAHPEIADLLERAAFLKNSLRWLDGKPSQAVATTRELDKAAWRFERMAEINEVASPEDEEAMKKLMANVEVILDEETKPSVKQDLGVAERELFDELLPKK